MLFNIIKLISSFKRPLATVSMETEISKNKKRKYGILKEKETN